MLDTILGSLSLDKMQVHTVNVTLLFGKYLLKTNVN